MCNLYNITTSQDALREWTRAMGDRMGNLEPSLDVCPNMPGPVVRNAPDGQRELAELFWGMPTPAERVKGKAGLRHHQHPQPAVRPLAAMRWRGEPLCGARHELRGAEPKPNDKDPETDIQRN